MAEKGPLSGKLLGGKYLLGNVVGKGGFGSVYSADHQELKRTQAIKVLQEHHFNEQKFRDRFLREAQMVAALDHVNIVHIDDFGVEEQDSRAYLVMPYVSGGTFHDFLEKQREALSLEQVTTYLEQICGALSYAHQHNVIHLDLKPLNLLVHADKRLLLSDFGLAHLLERDVLKGESSLLLGTPYYMAPERFQHQPSRYSDIYSVGILLYRMLTGRLPFVGETQWVVMMQHISRPVPSLQAFRPEVPSEMVEVLQKALAKQPAQRYQSADELLRGFKAVLTLVQERAHRAEEEQSYRVKEEAKQQRNVLEAQIQGLRRELNNAEIAHTDVVETMRRSAQEEMQKALREQGIKMEEELFLRLQQTHVSPDVMTPKIGMQGTSELHSSSFVRSHPINKERSDQILPSIRRRHVTRFLTEIGLGALVGSGATVATYELVPQVLQTSVPITSLQLQGAFHRGMQMGEQQARKDFASSLTSLEGVSLEGAASSAQLTRVAYDVFVSPIVQFSANIAGDFLSTMLQALRSARGWLAQGGQDNSTLATIQKILESWVAQVSNMPKQLDAITDNDINDAQAYLHALQHLVESEQNKSHGTTPAIPASTLTPSPSPH